MTDYRRAKLERFGLYLQADGLLTRLTTYKDRSCECCRAQQKDVDPGRAGVGSLLEHTWPPGLGLPPSDLAALSPLCLMFVLGVEGTEVELVKEWYQGRNDHLELREFNQVLRVTTEHFQPGRRFHLLRKSTSRRRSVPP